MPSLEQLRQRYEGATDEELRAAVAAGVGAYTPEAWSVIDAERTRRNLSVDEQPVEDPPAAEAPEEPVHVELSALAQRGREKLHTVAGLALASIVIVSVIEMIAGEWLVPLALRILAGVALVIKLREGRRWALWALAVMLALSCGHTAWTLVGEWSTFDVDARLFFGGLTAAWLSLGLVLVGSPSINAYIAERQRVLKKQTVVLF